MNRPVTDWSAQAIDTLVDARTQIGGSVQFAGGLQLEGKVAGDLRAQTDQPSRLVISHGAEVLGAVAADFIEIHGCVRGDVQARKGLILGDKAQIYGDTQYGELQMAAGAVIRGKLSCLNPGN